MIKYAINNLSEIRELIRRLSSEQYTRQLDYLNNSSIGEHVRHILEFYVCLLESVNSGEVNYDNRKRNRCIEQETGKAIGLINTITTELAFVDKDLCLEFKACYSTGHEEKTERFQTTFFRELAYNLEHSVHHQALIKVALLEMKLLSSVGPNFGVAASTIRFKSDLCVQ